MKKIFVIAMLAVLMCGCDEKKGSSENAEQNAAIEELTRENEQLRQETDDLLATINEIEDGFREINEAQGHLSMARRGEGANAKQRIQEDMQFIRQTMAQNAELIKKLQTRLQQSGKQSDQLKHTIENLMAQMEQKNQEIEELRSELAAKNIRIEELDEQVANLNEDLNNLQQQNAAQDQTISQQDQQINAAWYALGTKRELKNHNILKNGNVLQDGFDASYFTQIDIRKVNSISLNTKDPKILTTHPAGSYSLERGDNKLYTLHITNYEQFWSTSKYLVVQVK
jgi:DNA repair exonuclease SbcCD ATPase subunit